MTDADFVFSAMLRFEGIYLSKMFTGNYLKLQLDIYFYCISIYLNIQQVIAPPSNV